jgi:RNA ligase (TIGR02306 family)
MAERKMATIRKIAEIKAIPEADLICAYRVDGWWVVDTVGKYSVGDLVVYAEPDSWVPTTIAPFLSKGKEPRVYDGIQGEKLKTIKLKGSLSQGLLFNLTLFGEYTTDINGNSFFKFFDKYSKATGTVNENISDNKSD